METNINSILSRLRNLIYSNKIEEASLIAEPYTVATDYVLQHCNHKLEPMYKDFTVFKYKYFTLTFTGKVGYGNGACYGNKLPIINGNGYGNGYGGSLGDGYGDGNGYGDGKDLGNGYGDGKGLDNDYCGSFGEGYGNGEGYGYGNG